MFNHEKSVACAFSLLLKPSNLGLFGKLVSFGAVFQAFYLIFKLELQFFAFSVFKVQFEQSYDLVLVLFAKVSRVKLPYS